MGMADFLSENPLVLLIAACEIGFWILLLAGLAARYLLRKQRLSTVLLLSVPVLDLILVIASLLDVAQGATPGLTHGLAGLYLGFTVAFGHPTIKWADAQFAYRFAGGPPPPKPPKHGKAAIVREWRDWGRLMLAWAIAIAVMAASALTAGRGIPVPTEWAHDPMWHWALRVAPVALIWFVVGPLWTTLVAGHAEHEQETTNAAR